MSDPVTEYQQAAAAPPIALAWRMHEAGLENFGVNHDAERLPIPQIGPRELLTRVDALGLCFSDIKLITQGAKHPRIFGRDLAADPVTPGHEVSLTIVGVGADLRHRFHVGERYIVQADVYVNGVNLAYGYAISGGMSQYGVVDERITDGDEGCYLLPVQTDIGYAEAALTEPWACVVAAYRIRPRDGIKAAGTALFLGLPDAQDDYTLSAGFDALSSPAIVIAANVGGRFGEWLRRQAAALGIQLVERPARTAEELAALKAELAPTGFDDIIALGSGDTDLIEAAAGMLANGGVMNIVSQQPLSRAVRIDVGRVHYDALGYVGGPGPEVADSYSSRDSELAGGPAWFIGAGGPMGQMHVQRAAMLEEAPEVIVNSDVDDERLATLEARCRAVAGESCARMVTLNPKNMAPAGFDAALRQAAPEGFSDIVVMAPVPALIEEAGGYLAPEGTLNIFAGLARGTMATLDLSATYLRGVRWVGSSGSRVADLEYTLRATEAGRLSTNLSVGAIGDMSAVREGLEGVKAGEFAGKVVIFPQIEGVPLTSLGALRERLPEVYAKLGPGETWTREAERELLRLRLPRG